jgi:antitoxin MazE
MPTVQLWGNSLALRLPKPVAERLGLHQGVEVDLQVEGDRLVIARRHAARTPLADLLAQCRPENQPDTIDFGPPVGRESL